MPLRYLNIGESEIDAFLDRVIARCRIEIQDFRVLPDDIIDTDVRPMTRWHTEFLQSSLEADVEPSHEIFRNSTVRRFRQGVTVQSLIRYYEVWAEEIWQEAQRSAPRQQPPVALRLASHLANHLETARSAVSRIYLEEIAGTRSSGQRLRSDLLEALVSTQESDDFVGRVLITLQIDLAAPHFVLALRHRGKRAPKSRDLELALIESVKYFDRAGFLIAANGIRHDDIVIIGPLTDRRLQEAEDVAHSIAEKFCAYSVGISGAMTGPGAIALGYRSALTGMTISPTVHEHRAYTSRDARLNRVLRSSEHVEPLRESILRSLEAYDLEHSSDLLLTARTFIHTNFNAKLAAQHLHIQPNSVRYRLGRIRELTGSDPLTADGILEIMIALRSIGPT
jgi:hypothetical protein